MFNDLDKILNKEKYLRDLCSAKMLNIYDKEYVKKYEDTVYNILVKNNINYDDFSSPYSRNYLRGYSDGDNSGIYSSKESKNNVIYILYKEGISLYPKSSERRKMFLYRKIKHVIMHGNYGYGMLLMDPYTLEEVENFEREFSNIYNIHNYKIPIQLRTYLLEVSREMNAYSYYVGFNITTKNYYLDDEKDRYNLNEYDYEIPEEMYDTSIIYEIGDGGCAFSIVINMISGNIYHKDEGSYYLRKDTFNELLDRNT